MRRHRLPLVVALGVVAASAGAETRTYGKPLTGLTPTPLADLLAKPEAGRLVRLEGTIAAVCRNKGCWLELKQDARSVHVTFEGYSFFVPKDSAGRPVVLEGRVRVEAAKPDEVKHLEAEGAKAAGSGVSIEATGVEIRDAPK
jgi:hypothetical protein